MYERILVPLDGSHESEAALGYVERLTAGRTTEVRLVQVADHGLEITDPKHEVFLHKVEEAAQEQAHAYLTYIASVLNDEGVKVSTSAAHGRPADALLEEVEAFRADLVVMMSHGRSGFDRFAHGSVAWELRHRLRVPMLVVPSGPQAVRVQPWGDLPRVTDIVVPLDGSPAAELALADAAFLAPLFGAGVSLVRVLTRPTMSTIESESLAYYFEMEAELTDYAEAYLKQQATRFPESVAVTTRVLRGTAAQCILQYVADLDHPLVCITTHGRSGVGRVVLGSVAERVTQASGAPVLLVRAGHG